MAPREGLLWIGAEAFPMAVLFVFAFAAVAFCVFHFSRPRSKP